MDTHRPRRSPRARGANSCAALAGVESRRVSDPATIGVITATDVFGHGLVAVASVSSRLVIRGDMTCSPTVLLSGSSCRVETIRSSAISAPSPRARRRRTCRFRLWPKISTQELCHRSIDCCRAEALLISRRVTAQIAMRSQLSVGSGLHHGVRRAFRKMPCRSRSLAAAAMLEATC